MYNSILTSARCEYKLLQFIMMVDKGDVGKVMVKVFSWAASVDVMHEFSLVANLS
jgi:hypothetical protein